MESALAALREHLVRRNELLRAGSRPVGWRLGVGERERLDGSITVGHSRRCSTRRSPCSPPDVLLPLVRVKRILEVLRAPTDRDPRWEHQRRNLRSLANLPM
jgi:hypothetical protein